MTKFSLGHRRHSFQIVLALSLTCCCTASAIESATTVHNYPHLPGDEVSGKFSLTANRTKVPCIKYEKGNNRNFAVARFASADATPTYTVTIDEDITDYRIHPSRYYPADAVTVSGNSITFQLNSALRYTIVELNGAKPYLAIVNDPPEQPALVPDVYSENVLSVREFVKDATGEADVSPAIAAAIDELYRNDQYDTLIFPAGVYLHKGLELRGRTSKPVTIYLSEGALLKNRLQPSMGAMEPAVGIWDSSDITIRGRGMIDGNGYANYDTAHGGWRHDAVSSHHQGGVMVVRSKNVTFQDTYLRDSKQWNFETHTSQNVAFRNIKAFTPYQQPWIDGINLASGQNILVDGALTLGNDDCFASGHYNPNNLFLEAEDRLDWDTEDTHGIAVRNTLHWSCEAGNGIRLGHGVKGHKILSFEFDNFNAVNFKGGDRGISVERGPGNTHDYPHCEHLIFRNCSFDTSRVSRNMQIIGLDSNTRIDQVQITDCWFSNPTAQIDLQNINNLTVTGLHLGGQRIKHIPTIQFHLDNVANAQLDFDINADSANHAGIQLSNPVFDGYFGDPTVIVHNSVCYLMATKDPWGGDDLACFSTSDFKSWESHTLNWPTYEACKSPTKNNNKVWAPEIIQGPDDRFYLYVSVGSEIYCGVAPHPLGPWENVTGGEGPIIASQKGSAVHTIDASPFIDSDGRIYLYWGSGHDWKNGQCMVAELESDMHTLKGAPKNITPPNYFEAPHLIKRNGKYYLMYSQGKTIDKTYQIHYAVGDSPLGPFLQEGKNSPILSTDEEKKVWGPGHHCIFAIGNQDYIAYHRHKRPYDSDPIRRQICFDKLSFDKDGWIEPVEPTDSGIVAPVDALK